MGLPEFLELGEKNKDHRAVKKSVSPTAPGPDHIMTLKQQENNIFILNYHVRHIYISPYVAFSAMSSYSITIFKKSTLQGLVG